MMLKEIHILTKKLTESDKQIYRRRRMLGSRKDKSRKEAEILTAASGIKVTI
jgi:hypothetical protein